MKPALIIGVESLEKLFEQNSNPEQYNFHCNCHHCGCSVEVEITKTSVGYGMSGGVLYETNPQNFLGLCVDCYEKTIELE